MTSQTTLTDSLSFGEKIPCLTSKLMGSVLMLSIFTLGRGRRDAVLWWNTVRGLDKDFMFLQIQFVLCSLNFLTKPSY